jgi:serpin B
VLVIIVPDGANTLAAIEASLSGEILEATVKGDRIESLDLEMPAFEVAPKESIDLKPALESLGVRRIFGTPELRRLSPDPLTVADFLHRSVIRVDERGTEAAAATGEVLVPRGVVSPEYVPPPRFVVDRPFLFLLADRSTGVVLQIGRIVDPSR